MQDETWVISPFTQERVKASDLQKHVKYQLIDPNWKDEREKQIQQKKAEDEVYAAGKFVYTILHISISNSRLKIVYSYTSNYNNRLFYCTNLNSSRI